MTVDINSAATAQGQYGPFEGEDRDNSGADNASHNDQLGIRHSDPGQGLLTVVLGNTVKGSNHEAAPGTSANKYEEDVRPGRLWIVPDPWGDSADTNNAAYPDWWVNPAVTGGFDLGVFLPDRPQDFYNNLLTVDMKSNMTALSSDGTGLEQAHAYPVAVFNRVFLDSSISVGEVGCIGALTTVETASTGASISDVTCITGNIAIRAPLQKNGLAMGPFWASLTTLYKGSSASNDVPEITDYANYRSEYPQTAGEPFEGIGQPPVSRIKFMYGYHATQADGTGFGTFGGGGYAAGFAVSAPGLLPAGSPAFGNRVSFGYVVKDLAGNPESKIEDLFVGLKIMDQNTAPEKSNCAMYGIQIGDMNAIAGNKNVAIWSANGSATFGRPNPSDVDNIHFFIGGTLAEDATSKDAFGLLTLQTPPTDWDFNNPAHIAVATVGQLNIANAPFVDGGTDKTGGIYGIAGGVTLNECTVDSKAVIVGFDGFFQQNNATAEKNVTADDIAAVAAEYFFVASQDLGTLERPNAGIKNAFGLYAMEPKAGASEAKTSAAVFDGDVILGKNINDGTNPGKLFLNGDSKWRTSSAMTKGSATIGYASSQIQLSGADVKVTNTNHFLPPSSSGSTAPNNSTFIETDAGANNGKLVFKDGAGTINPLY